MIHTASLIHDDIVDGALLRRGQRALHRAWGTKLSVLMGDYLFAWNISMLSRRFPSPVVRRLIDASRSLCDGEIEEAGVAFRADLGTERYLRIIGKKTAALMETACEAGAILAGAPEAARSGLARFGRAFGMAFQLVDDAMDFTGDERVAGKTLGGDMADGRFTMPVLSLLAHLKGKRRDRFRRLLAKPSLSNGGASRAAMMVVEHGGVARTLELARTFTGGAVAALRGVPSSARVPLETLAELALRRRS
jgi:octaprenyl-diphosphate synthase